MNNGDLFVALVFCMDIMFFRGDRIYGFMKFIWFYFFTVAWNRFIR